MSDVVKWTVIALAVVAIVSILVSWTSFMSYFGSLGTSIQGFSTTVTNFISYGGSFVLIARRLINNFVPAPIFSAVLFLQLTKPVVGYIVHMASSLVQILKH